MRIKSIAIVHQKLYQAGLYSELDIRDYFNELIKHYHLNIKHHSKRDLVFNIDSVTRPHLELQKAISFALLFNELISNSIENAFEDNFLRIDISIEKIENSIVIIYKDSGKGLPVGVSDFNNGGFGFRLIVNFIKQLKATIDLEKCNNFCAKIVIPIHV
jgi:two-component sensor histidine kinase